LTGCFTERPRAPKGLSFSGSMRISGMVSSASRSCPTSCPTPTFSGIFRTRLTGQPCPAVRQPPSRLSLQPAHSLDLPTAGRLLLPAGSKAPAGRGGAA
jgi:hypothetical protein